MQVTSTITNKANCIIIIIFENALCTEAFELKPENKKNSVMKVKLSCYAENGGDLDTLPVKIYYPSAA